ncbi:MAG TPA: c-type cytochrome domain-containing protein [Planctomycetota bacterium]|nr:c-type cytochrome domain-containing protein [Planctomycetota bacterium]
MKNALCLSVLIIVPLLAAADKTPVSFSRDIAPILRANCQGCHKPEKKKGGLDLSTYAALLKGGKHGITVKARDTKSLLLEQVRGKEPEMPPEGDPLKPAEVALLERWVMEGATDDTGITANVANAPVAAAAEYHAAPAVTALAWSPDGSALAVAGYREVLLHKPDGSGVIARLPCEATRIESLTYSRDGKILAACGGYPGLFGQVLLWDAATQKPLAAHKLTSDSLFGLSLSPDGTRVAVGCADRTARIIAASDGKELMKFDQHTDWVFATVFNNDGKRVITGSRDRAIKMINAETGELIDDLNKSTECVLALTRHPTEEIVVFGGDKGLIRSYKMADAKRDEKNDDPYRLKEYERLPGAVQTLVFSPDGKFIAAGGQSKEVRISKFEGGRAATLTGFTAPVFALAFSPDSKQIAVSGMDGIVRLFDTSTGKPVKEFVSIPGVKTAAAQPAAGNSEKAAK